VTLAAVSDAGPLIHLAEIDSLELLAAFDTLLVPETVYPCRARDHLSSAEGIKLWCRCSAGPNPDATGHRARGSSQLR